MSGFLPTYTGQGSREPWKNTANTAQSAWSEDGDDEEEEAGTGAQRSGQQDSWIPLTFKEGAIKL